ncbi:uncharacterized protein LOC132725905 [Ruditapes philippinarum]|uniref:uncharacterized protein LOC132725905 n=1 Tax=Ruditapes philippinarum TaxID=129788 RepID=UPI00295B2058|nr:uncharacterized protein LOC132725905 [Ruditapes philippinarum]
MSILFLAYIFLGFANLVTSQSTIRCRSCNRASTLSDCNKLVVCDATLEDCYMDQILTDQLTVVYEGGCRAKTVCSSSGRKRNDFIACSRCCDYEEDCNRHLCGIKDDTISISQCYSCDYRTSEQSEVKDPKSCVTLDTCQPNEVCYATMSDIGGKDTFFYGCLSKLQCRFLMNNAYNEYKMCVTRSVQPPPGMTYDQACGHIGKRATSLCHSCCADGGCNYGTCQELNARIFRLADAGKFDMNTLKVI